jgi:branched-chain amino acid transport system substrate-binding protein
LPWIPPSPSLPHFSTVISIFFNKKMLKWYKAFVLKMIFFLLTFCVSLALGLSCALYAEPRPLRIGMLVSLTGDFAFFGAQAKQGALIAAQDISRSTGEKIELIFEDDKCLPKEAVDGLTKLVKVDGVSAVVGPGCTGAILAIAPIANQTRTYTLALLDANKEVSKAGPFIYALGFISEEEGMLVAETMRRRKITQSAVLYEEDGWAVVVKNAFIKHFTSLGGKIVGEESQLATNKDYRSALLKLLQKHPQALYIVPAYSGGVILKQLRTMDPQIPVFGPDTFAVDESLTTAPKESEGLILSDMALNENGTGAEQLRKRLTQRFGSAPRSLLYPAMGYDGVKIVYQALRSGKPFPEAMAKINYQDGVMPVAGFGQDRLSKLSPQLRIIHNGVPVSLPE